MKTPKEFIDKIEKISNGFVSVKGKECIIACFTKGECTSKFILGSNPEEIIYSFCNLFVSIINKLPDEYKLTLCTALAKTIQKEPIERKNVN